MRVRIVSLLTTPRTFLRSTIFVLFLPILSGAFAQRVEAQVGTVRGQVLELVTSTPLVSVEVTIVGTNLRVLTDVEGRYVLTGVPTGSRTITVRRIGYGTESRQISVTPGAALTADFSLGSMAVQLSEVVVTATGEQRKVELGNVIGTVNMDSLVTVAPLTGVLDAINGRVAGVSVFSNSGITGSAPRIRIRGFNSLTGSNNPLMIVDGIRVESGTGSSRALGSGQRGGGGGYGWTTGRVQDLNPEEIESIEVIKGPSAATLYGTDAANGVIVVKTKRGRAGRTAFTVYGEHGLVTQPNDFNTGYYAWGTDATSGLTTRCDNTARVAGSCALDSLAVWNPMKDAASSPIGTGYRNQFGAQATGGVEVLNFFVSTEYEEEKGYLELSNSEILRLQAERGGAEIPSEQRRPNYLDRLAVRGNVTANLGTSANISLNNGLTFQKSQLPGLDVFYGGAWGPGYQNETDGFLGGNRPGESFAIRSQEDIIRVTSSANANWNPTPWLSTRGTVGLDFSHNDYDNLQRRDEGPSGTFGAGTQRLGRRLEIGQRAAYVTVDMGGTASYNVGSNVAMRSSVGTQYARRYFRSQTSEGLDLPPGSETVAGAATITTSEATVENIVAGVYAEQTVDLGQRLFLTGAIRADGASSFGKNFDTAIYPKASLSWLVSEEGFFPTGSFLSSLRYRLAYGASGVQPDAVAALPQLALTTVFVNGGTVGAARLDALGNPDLKPERSTEIETGLDIEFFDGRMALEGTYYYRKSTDALVRRAMPRSVGILGPGRLENIGEVRNSGWEATLDATLINSNNFTFQLLLNGGINSNELTKLASQVTPPEDRFIKFVEGFPLFGQWDRKTQSVEDTNGDGILQTSEVVMGDSIEFLGVPNPTDIFNATPIVTLFNGKLQLSSLFEYRGGWIQTNFTELNKCNFGGCRARNDPDATIEDQARWIGFSQSGFSYEPYAQDGTFLRWREASLSYRLPEGALSSLGMRNVQFIVSARNLHVWTGYDGVDPEVTANPSLAGNFGTIWDLGYDNPVSPPSSYWIFRINVGL